MIFQIVGIALFAAAAVLVVLQVLALYQEKKRRTAPADAAAEPPAPSAAPAFVARLRLSSLNAPADINLLIDAPDYEIRPERLRDARVYRDTACEDPSLQALRCRIVYDGQRDASMLVVQGGEVALYRAGEKIERAGAYGTPVQLGDRIDFCGYSFQVKSANLIA